MANEKIHGKDQRRNVPEMTVSELAFSLKKTLEDGYGHVRIRGELSRVKIHSSGHLYSDLKDAQAVINIVCWKGTVARLAVVPEEGLEVICTGRISTYPARSNYQMIVEAMELAGEGALLKLLEERKRKLAAEGLFDAAHKKPLPFLPGRIGVVTSPTGAVIRDILHRLDDRFPRDVLLWPVAVQGPGAATQIAAAIDGFNALPPSLRPDLLIVARGGGSLEDLMAFNEESVVRAAARSGIPLIAAIGHETDTTLIDYAADLRAPTPTGAAEMAVPRRADLRARLLETAQRLAVALDRRLAADQDKLAHLGARLGDPARLMEGKTQRLDLAAARLGGAFGKNLAGRRETLARLGGLLRHPRTLIAEKARHLNFQASRLALLPATLLKARTKDLAAAGRMLESLSFKSILKRGFVVVRADDGQPLTGVAMTHTGQSVQLEFADGRAAAVIDANPRRSDKQGQLF